MKYSIVIGLIHLRLLNKADPAGRIERRRLFEIIAERLGRIPDNKKEDIVRELEENKIIIDSDKISFKINKILSPSLGIGVIKV